MYSASNHRTSPRPIKVGTKLVKRTLYGVFMAAVCGFGDSSAALAQSGVMPATTVTNQTLITFPGGPHAFLIANLRPDDGSDYDHLHLLVTLGGWGSVDPTSYDVTFGNRNGLGYIYTVRGAMPSANARLAAYRNTHDNSVDIWLVFTAMYETASYTVLENEQDQVFTNPTDTGTVTSSGSLLFDSSDSRWPPVTQVDYPGNFTIDNDAIVRGNFLNLGPSGGALYSDTANTVVQAPNGGSVYLVPVGYDGTRVGPDGSIRIGGGGNGTESGARLIFADGTSVNTASGFGGSLPQVNGNSSVNGILRVTGNTSPNTDAQGAYLGWNALNGGGVGETDFINNQGTGSGGFAFFNRQLQAGSGLNLLMYVQGNGNLGLGTSSPGAKLEVNGNVKLTANSGSSITFPDSTVQSTAWNGTTLGGDYAEAVDVMGARASYEPGDVIVINVSADGKFMKSDAAYSRFVAGVYSTKPGLIGRRTTAERFDKNAEVPMAMMGIVPTKVSSENGPIERGDLLVSSSKSGYAMKGTDRSRMMGAVIGKALAPLKAGVGVIEVLVSLQ